MALTPQQVLDLPLEGNDADASTVREYLAKLAELVVREDEGFDGKRPFGNSGWVGELYAPLVAAGAVEAEGDDDDRYPTDDREARALLEAAARALAEPAQQPPKMPTKCGWCPQIATRRLEMTNPDAAVQRAGAAACREHVTDATLWLAETVSSA